MAHTKTKRKKLAVMPVEERERTLRIERMERRLARKKSSGRIIGVLAAYDNLVREWYEQFDRINGKK